MSFLEEIVPGLATDSSVLTIIVGDFNVDVLAGEQEIDQLLSHHDYHQLVNKSTHTSGSLLDHVYVKVYSGNVDCTTIACYYSDHDIVKVIVGL